MAKRRLELEVETETIVLRGQAPVVSWCGECERLSPRITPSQAAMIAGVTDMAVYKMIKRGLLHPTETPDGRLQVCLRSLTGIERTHDVAQILTHTTDDS